MPASHLFGGKDTPCPINRTDVSYMLLHDGNPNVYSLLDFTQYLEGSGIDKMVLVEGNFGNLNLQDWLPYFLHVLVCLWIFTSLAIAARFLLLL